MLADAAGDELLPAYIGRGSPPPNRNAITSHAGLGAAFERLA